MKMKGKFMLIAGIGSTINRHKWHVWQLQQTTNTAHKPGSPKRNISSSEVVRIEYPFVVSKTKLRFPDPPFCKQKLNQMPCWHATTTCSSRLKANSHIPCSSHAVPLPR
jgi:hypothetical protein